MPASKREKKLQKQRQKKKRKDARKARQRTAYAARTSAEADPRETAEVDNATGWEDSAFDLPESDFASTRPVKNPEIDDWWNEYLAGDGAKRLSLVQAAIQQDLDEQWTEALFPEAVFELEPKVDSGQYVALLEELERDHPAFYRKGSTWFLRSRVSHYLNRGDESKAAEVATAHARELTETTEAFFGTVAMLRLCGQAEAAEALAAAAFEVVDESDLMPWAIDEIFHVLFFREMVNCISAGADDDAFGKMESELAKIDINTSQEMVDLRREMTLRLAGKVQTKWSRKQLTASGDAGLRDRSFLLFEFAGWLVNTTRLPQSAADELRNLIQESIERDTLSMRDYLDGVREDALDHHLGSLLGFLCLDRFKAPATLLAVNYFAKFLNERGLDSQVAYTKTTHAADSLTNQLARLFNKEGDSDEFQFVSRIVRHMH